MKNGTRHWASTDTPFSSGCLTSLPHAHHAVAGFHRKTPKLYHPSLGARAVGGQKLGFTPRTWTWLQVGEGLRKGLKDLKLWARRPSARLPRPPRCQQVPLPATDAHPSRTVQGPGLGSFKCFLSFLLLPDIDALAAGATSLLPASPMLATAASLPATLSLPPSHSLSSFTLSLFPAGPLEEPEALTLSLCFQDFRKYEEGFDPYSMVRDDSPALGSKPRSRGGGLWSIWWRCLLGSEGPGDELWAVKSPKEALACEGFFQTAFHCELCVCVLCNNSYTC